MPTLRLDVSLPWVPAGLDAQIEVAGRFDSSGVLVPIRARSGGVRARRGWLRAARKGMEADLAAIGGDAKWVLGARRRSWATIAKRYPAAKAEAERLAHAGLVEIECDLAPQLTLSSYSGWRLIGEAASAAARATGEIEALRNDTERELRHPDLIARLREERPPAGMAWADVITVLRAAERWRDFRTHGTLPQRRELAGLVSHSKWQWTEPRTALLAEFVDHPVNDLFAVRPRNLRVHGPLNHSEGGVWDVEVDTLHLEVTRELLAIVCIENFQTFDALYPLSHEGLLLLQVPGGPLPAETRLLRRLHELAPLVPVYASFDPDPAGIAIALRLQRDSGVALLPDLMTADLLAATTPLALDGWDIDCLARLSGKAGQFTDLWRAIDTERHKGEQEPANRLLTERLKGLVGLP